MNLYRLDPALPTDPLWRTFRPTETSIGCLNVAKARAKRLNEPVIVSQISGRTLRVAATHTVHPDGCVEQIRRQSR